MDDNGGISIVVISVTSFIEHSLFFCILSIFVDFVDSVKPQITKFNKYMALKNVCLWIHCSSQYIRILYVCTDCSSRSTNIHFLLDPQILEFTNLNDFTKADDFRDMKSQKMRL